MIPWFILQMDTMESYFDCIRDELIHITQHLPINDIINLCLVNSRFNLCLWQNDLFWLSRLSYELGIVPDNNDSGNKNKWSKDLDPSKGGSWRNLYFNSFNVWVIGSNLSSELGVKDTIISQLTQIPNFKAINVNSSDKYTLAIDINNNVYVWGSSQFGELGLGDEINRNFPTLLPGIKAKSISCGLYTSFIIDPEDKLLAFGTNSIIPNNAIILELSNGNDSGEHISYCQVTFPFKVKEISCGFSFTVVRDFEDRIWGWGSNEGGQLGTNEKYHLNPVLLTDIRVKQISTELSKTLIIDYDDNVWESGVNVLTFTQIEGIKAKRIICGYCSSAIINFENELFMFGDNTYGQLGLGDTIHRLVPTKIPNIKVNDVSLDCYHSILLDVKGNVWICGTDWEMIGHGLPTMQTLILNPKLLSNIKARKILALKQGSIIIGINN